MLKDFLKSLENGEVLYLKYTILYKGKVSGNIQMKIYKEVNKFIAIDSWRDKVSYPTKIYYNNIEELNEALEKICNGSNSFIMKCKVNGKTKIFKKN